MGCHTWYRKPQMKGKENIQEFLREEQECFKKESWWDEECEVELPKHLKAIDELDTFENMPEELRWYIYTRHVIYQIDGELVLFEKYEHDSDEPRIGGYPDAIIRSKHEMFDAIKNGIECEDGILRTFNVPEDRKELIYERIENFFREYPDGIISFG